MTSIFHSSFVDNLRRIQSGSPKASAPSSGSSQPAVGRAEKGFSEVLADIERKVKTGSSDREIQADLKAPDLPPSAVLPELLVSPDHPLFSFQPRTQPEDFCKVSECSPSVKADVKVPAFVPDAEELPPMPVVKSAERISLAIPGGTREPIRYSKPEIENIISTAGKYHGIDPDLSMAVAQAESSFRPDAVSSDGFSSKGIFQLLDSTAADLIGRFDVTDQYDPFDPAMNAYLGVGYLRRLHDLFGESSNLGGNLRTHPAATSADLEKISLAAFNAGEGNVARAQERARAVGKDPATFEAIEPFLPPSTRTYVERVLQYRTQFAQGRDGNPVA